MVSSVKSCAMCSGLDNVGKRIAKKNRYTRGGQNCGPGGADSTNYIKATKRVWKLMRITTSLKK